MRDTGKAGDLLERAAVEELDVQVKPLDGSSDSPYRPLIEWQLNNLRNRISDAFDPEIVAELFVTIANSDQSRLRWPADPMAEKVLETMLAQNDPKLGYVFPALKGSKQGHVDLYPSLRNSEGNRLKKIGAF